jgi:hypothetical protein
MRQTATDHRRTHRVPLGVAGSQFTLDAYSHGSASYRGFRYGDIFTDINTGASYAIMTKDRGAEELCLRSGALFDSHPEWRSTGSDIDRFIRVDPELSHQSIQFMQHASKYGYRVEATPPRDKHANGIAERAVGIISAKTNLQMLAPTPRVPNKYWCLCMEYACKTASLNYHRKIGTMPYFFVYGQHVNIKHLHPFWARCWVFIALEDRKGKVGFPRAYKAHFLGYESSRTLEPTFKVIQVHSNGTYGKVGISKDVIFDDTIDFHNETVSPPDSDFNRGIDEQDRIVPVIRAPMPLIAPSVQPIPAPMPSTVPSPIMPEALPKALPRQDARPIKAPVARIVVPPPKPAGLLEDPIPPVPELLPPTVPSQPARTPSAAIPPTQPLLQSGEHTHSDTLTRSQRKPVTYHKLPTIHPSTNIDIENIDINEPIVSNEFGDMVYW